PRATSFKQRRRRYAPSRSSAVLLDDERRPTNVSAIAGSQYRPAMKVSTPNVVASIHPPRRRQVSQQFVVVPHAASAPGRLSGQTSSAKMEHWFCSGRDLVYAAI